MIPVLIVPVLNRYDLLKRMLDSIDYPVEKLVLIDNNPKSNFLYETDNELITEFYHLKMPSNLGVPASWNLGIKSTPFADYWMIVNNDAWFPQGSMAKFAEVSVHDKLILASQEPPWCAFTIGKNYIIRVGLFDEGIYPAYFEDNDYVRRCQRADLSIYKSDIPVNHDNSSTLQAGFQEQNGKTYVANMVYYDNKVKSNDYSEGHWSLLTRLQNSWD